MTAYDVVTIGVAVAVGVAQSVGVYDDVYAGVAVADDDDVMMSVLSLLVMLFCMCMYHTAGRNHWCAYDAVVVHDVIDDYVASAVAVAVDVAYADDAGVDDDVGIAVYVHAAVVCVDVAVYDDADVTGAAALAVAGVHDAGADVGYRRAYHVLLSP